MTKVFEELPNGTLPLLREVVNWLEGCLLRQEHPLFERLEEYFEAQSSINNPEL